MNLWLIERTDADNCGWDVFLGFVVRAKNEIEARAIAAERDYGSSLWADPSQARCTHIGQGRGGPGLVLDSFKAG